MCEKVSASGSVLMWLEKQIKQRRGARDADDAVEVGALWRCDGLPLGYQVGQPGAYIRVAVCLSVCLSYGRTAPSTAQLELQYMYITTSLLYSCACATQLVVSPAAAPQRHHTGTSGSFTPLTTLQAL